MIGAGLRTTRAATPAANASPASTSTSRSRWDLRLLSTAARGPTGRTASRAAIARRSLGDCSCESARDRLGGTRAGLGATWAGARRRTTPLRGSEPRARAGVVTPLGTGSGAWRTRARSARQTGFGVASACGGGACRVGATTGGPAADTSVSAGSETAGGNGTAARAGGVEASGCTAGSAGTAGVSTTDWVTTGVVGLSVETTGGSDGAADSAAGGAVVTGSATGTGADSGSAGGWAGCNWASSGSGTGAGGGGTSGGASAGSSPSGST